MPQDDIEAGNWYRKAAEQGYAVAQFNLGRMYDQGTGVPQDDVKAVNWYRKAAEQGDAVAQFNLGRMCAESGQAVTALHHHDQNARRLDRSPSHAGP